MLQEALVPQERENTSTNEDLKLREKKCAVSSLSHISSQE
jgi:hypothetical protein